MPIVVHVPVEFPDGTPPLKLRQVSKEVHENARKAVAAATGAAAAENGNGPLRGKANGRSLGGGVGASTPATAATRAAEELSQMLGKADATERDEGTNEKIYQGIISYRKIARQLPEETRAALDRKIAAYSNSQVKPKPAKRK
jgi:hypothetical protein